jgi:ribosomal-protein-alanine N-acetyltransferase
MGRISFTPFPNLATGRLNLRQLRSEDENKIFKLRSDERVMKFITKPKYKTIEEAQEFINRINKGISKNEWIYWGITLRNENTLIGTICLWNISEEHFRADIGFELSPDFQGKGMMQEALPLVLDYGFKIMKLHSIEANVNPNNLPSIRLLERNNFIREAYFKENFYYDGKFSDTAIYSLLAESDTK